MTLTNAFPRQSNLCAVPSAFLLISHCGPTRLPFSASNSSNMPWACPTATVSLFVAKPAMAASTNSATGIPGLKSGPQPG